MFFRGLVKYSISLHCVYLKVGGSGQEDEAISPPTPKIPRCMDAYDYIEDERDEEGYFNFFVSVRVLCVCARMYVCEHVCCVVCLCACSTCSPYI